MKLLLKKNVFQTCIPVWKMIPPHSNLSNLYHPTVVSVYLFSSLWVLAPYFPHPVHLNLSLEETEVSRVLKEAQVSGFRSCWCPLGQGTTILHSHCQFTGTVGIVISKEKLVCSTNTWYTTFALLFKTKIFLKIKCLNTLYQSNRELWHRCREWTWGRREGEG